MAEGTPEVKKDKTGFFKKISRSIRDMRGEMKKVVWPTKKQAVNNTVVVFVFMAIMAVMIGVFDLGLSAVVQLLLGRGVG